VALRVPCTPGLFFPSDISVIDNLIFDALLIRLVRSAEAAGMDPVRARMGWVGRVICPAGKLMV
jgi:hypothetical protein